ncbi:unnamed protein product [Oppiella nova]|uniref:Uncharacterized protein n=1 Tax=Oppiella nova TaxID=334625 RepID=A0A7R9LQ98_9ACAR|nr:unnamed protein product [Oppiella nova]CAG2165204.1 unnamed protein product [Oppiella nova]
MNVVEEINKRADKDGQQPLLSDVLGTPPTTLVGQTHAVTDSESYKARIDAVHFALDNDDGARTRHYDKADLILIGVSRSVWYSSCKLPINRRRFRR